MSPVLSVSGYQYYFVILDDFTHYVWTFPVRRKSEVHRLLVFFYAYVQTQFSHRILAFQTDNGREFDNHANRTLVASHGTLLRLTCPYTSQQNGKAERILRTLNDGVRPLLLHASMPPRWWAEALATTSYLLNRRPCKPRLITTPFELLFGRTPEFRHLRVFGCLCYPNLLATTPHKLSPRSVACVFLGYPDDRKGYRCYDPISRRIIFSRHATFVESIFPFKTLPESSPISTNPPPDPSSADYVDPADPAWVPPAPAAPCTPLDSPRMQPSLPMQNSPPMQPSPQRTTPSPTSTACGSSPTPAGPTSPTTAPNNSPTPPVPPASHLHPMLTRARHGIFQPNPRYANQQATTISPIPSSVRAALQDPNWRAAMQAENDALMANSTWTLVPRPPHTNIVSGKWVFRIKTKADGSLNRYIARWVVRGFAQRPGIDFG